MKIYKSPLDTPQKGSARSVWNPCPVLNDFNSDETDELVKTKLGEVVAA